MGLAVASVVIFMVTTLWRRNMVLKTGQIAKQSWKNLPAVVSIRPSVKP